MYLIALVAMGTVNGRRMNLQGRADSGFRSAVKAILSRFDEDTRFEIHIRFDEVTKDLMKTQGNPLQIYFRASMNFQRYKVCKVTKGVSRILLPIAYPCW